jgi:hypothetical protein
MSQTIINTTDKIASELILNSSESQIPFLFQNINLLINIIQAIGIFLIIYSIYLSYNFFVQYKNRKRIKDIQEKLLAIENKLDNLIRIQIKSSKSKKK